MPIPAREDIKATFQTGDTPTQAQFAALIDAMYDMAQQAQDTADDAVAAVEATLPLCLGALRVEIANNYGFGSGGHTETKYREQACTFTITHIGSTLTANPISGPKAYKATFQIDVTFNTAAANTLYTSNYSLSNKTINGCRFFVELPYLFLAPATPLNEPNWDNVTFTIWPG